MSEEAKQVLLLVDDTPANIQVALAILKDSYQVRVATSGARALELAASAPRPDLVLLDVMMPEMDGFEVCTRLKETETTRDIPVIFLTGQTEIEDETRGFEVGGVDYIHKPFSPAVVKARVHTHLALRGVQARLAQQLAEVKTEMETARRIQLSILPSSMPNIAGLDIAARYVPMTEVAGDFYDFIVVDDKRLGAFVGDVSGHGMPAALISSMLKIALAAQTPVAADPALVMAGLNEALCGKFQGHFVTAAYVFIDTEKKTIGYSGAGHPPLVLSDAATGTVQSVEENGLMLGAFSFASYTSVEIPFTEGMRALMYTDGIVEMSNEAREEFGGDRLAQFTGEHTGLSSEAFIDGLFVRLATWDDRRAGPEREDDLTVLSINFGGADSGGAAFVDPSAVSSS